MPISTPTFKPRTTTSVVGATTSTITNKSLPIANTEYSHILQADLKQIIIKVRGLADLKFTLVSGESSTKYFTIPKGNSLSLDNLSIASGTLYLQSPTASVTIEILELN